MPERKGFGHVVLEDVVPGMFGGAATLAFEPEGFTWTLDVALHKVSSAAGRTPVGNVQLPSPA